MVMTEARESETAKLVAALRAELGETTLTTDPDVLAGHTTDWTRRFSGPAAGLVRPSTTEEVVQVMAACNRLGIPVIPQGGNTSMVAGSVPTGAEDWQDRPLPIILSTLGLRRLDPVDTLTGTLTVGAGVTLAEVQHQAATAGWLYGVDLGARDTATIGGTCATNAGGIRVCAYGMTRRQVIGLEVVLADGSVISRLGGLPKDNTGYDLNGLMVGSEGTLGVITAVRLQLHSPPGPSTLALVGVESMAAALDLVASSVPAGEHLLGAEIIDAAGMALIAEVADLPNPLASPWPYVLLVEATGDWLNLPDESDAVVGMDHAARAKLWAYREKQPEAISTLGIAHKLDISVPLAHLDALTQGARELVPPDAVIIVFGHLRDGNLHVEIAGVPADDRELDHAIFELAAGLGGVLSAEHGVGRAKAAWLHMSRSEAEIATMRSIKSSLDPVGILNPGALLV